MAGKVQEATVLYDSAISANNSVPEHIHVNYIENLLRNGENVRADRHMKKVRFIQPASVYCKHFKNSIYSSVRWSVFQAVLSSPPCMPVVFNRDKTTTMKISKAIRFSMSIPLIFSFKVFEDC